ncbi:MAG TPA: ImcF-related family protein, partial [Telluria sp.]|nr:ImcF-related family protein [Telluria sp.]
EMSLASMAMPCAMRPGVFTFPLEFASMKPVLRAFLATLFEENTYQFRPVFRGFYFTSALQEGSVANLASQRVASRFNVELPKRDAETPAEEAGGARGYFLRELFRAIIFADKDLVARYTSPARTRLKYGAFVCAALTLGVALAGWSWSYSNNSQLVANVEADLAKVVQLQEKRTDLQSRLEALGILQDRIEQLEKYRADTPLMLSFGLYQGDTLERKLRDEYFAGVRDVMVRPVGAAIESLLADMNAQPGQLDPATQEGRGAGQAAGQPYQAASPTSVADTYNALKAYLMLGDKAHAETGHLYDQVTRFWRMWLEANRGDMPREQMVRSAERLLTFHIANVADPAWPQLQPKIGLLDTARENLRRVVRGIPARERVYADIRARASTRYPAVTVARLAGQQDAAFIAGSHAVPGAFTREAWEGYVHGAIRDAASRELASTDWVLRTATSDDLTLEGSPEQIEKALTELYKADYQVFDKGTLDDSEGREVDFRNTIIIMTSNAGSGPVMQACLNKSPEEMPSPAALAGILRPILVRHFKPAFLGRCTVVPFYPVGDDVLGEIVELKLQRIRERIYDQHHADFQYDEALVDAVLARCTEVDSGARNVDSIINGSVLPAIAESVLARIASGTPISRISASATGAGEFDYAFEPA